MRLFGIQLSSLYTRNTLKQANMQDSLHLLLNQCFFRAMNHYLRLCNVE